MQGSWQVFKNHKKMWNEFIEKNSHEFRQLYEWGSYKKKLGWGVLRLVYLRESEIEACAQILVKKSFILGSAYIPGGVCGNLKSLDASFKEIIQQEIKARFLYIRIDSAEPEKSKDKDHLIKNGFKRPLYKLNTPEYCALDLKKDNVEILAEAKQKWRYHHKRSLKKEIILEIETRSDHFIDMNRELTSAWNVRNTYTPREVFPLIASMEDKMITCTAKDKSSNLLGMRVAIVSGKTAYHHFNAVSKEGRDLLLGYRLLIFMLDVLRDRGIDSFNIGSTNKERFPGPYRFKVGIGHKNSLYTALGEWNYTSSFFLEKILNAFIKVYFNSPSFIRRFIKNF